MTADIEGRPTWDVRPLRADDVDVVAEVLGLARLSSENDGCYLVAWAAGAPLGHVHIAFAEPPELQDLEVQPSHRRLGVGSALVSAAEAECRARGFAEVRLEVSTANVAAQELYRACGYHEAGVPMRRVTGRIVLRTGPIEVDDTLLLLAKRLDG